jgi:uncharacterized membrane protein
MNSELEHAAVGDRDTGRLEAFSDGVFAIAITLLVLDLKVPEGDQLGDSLLSFLAGKWPSYLAFLTSFATIGIMWVNHHRLFTHIRRFDNTLLFLKNLLLLGVTITPWPTSHLALYLGETEVTLVDQSVAAMVYTGLFVLLAVFFNLLWRYASRGDRLLGRNVNRTAVRAITEQYRFGIVPYLIAFVSAALGGLSYAFVLVSVLLSLALAIYFALPGRPRTT